MYIVLYSQLQATMYIALDKLNNEREAYAMKANNNLSYIDLGLWEADDGRTLGLTAFWRGYGFSLEIVDEDADINEDGELPRLFKKFLKTDDCDYASNYLRKVVKNNFNARRIR